MYKQKDSNMADIKQTNSEKEKGFALPVKNVKLIIAGFLVLVVGYVLMIGGGTDNPELFNNAMFSFRRVVLAPIVIVGGIVIEIVAAVKIFKSDK